MSDPYPKSDAAIVAVIARLTQELAEAREVIRLSHKASTRFDPWVPCPCAYCAPKATNVA